MPSTLAEERLRKVLELERQKRFADRAVTSGLDAFLRNLAAREASQLGSAVYARIQRLPVAGYRSLTPDRRRAWVEETLGALAGRRNGAKQPSRRPAAAAPDPAVTPGRRTKAPAPRRRAAPAEQPQLGAVRRPSAEEAARLGAAAPLSALKRVPFSLAVKFDRLELHSVGDLLLFFPRRHADYGDPVAIAELDIDREQTVRGRVWSARERIMGMRLRSTEAVIGDDSGTMTCIWFNQPWVAKQLPIDTEIVVSGKVSEYQGRPKFDNPEWELWSDDLLHTGRLVPVYPLTAGLPNRTVRRVMREALDRFVGQLPDPLPPELRERLALEPIAEAVAQMHYPTDRGALEAARRRLAFQELLPIQLTMLLRRRTFQHTAPAQPLAVDAVFEQTFRAMLPFTLTKAQDRTLFEVLTDLRRPVPMTRLVQGDVGSGKTVIAAAAVLAAVVNGCQGAMMAPTEILAEQHFRTLRQLLGADETDGNIAEARTPFLDRPLRIALLTGGAKTRDRRAVLEAVERGEIDIACGTHALIQGGVRFRALGVAVVDEQHRFGVMQRAALREKGAQAAVAPHMLVMTATPIPRTLALTVYGDLDISVIDELPPGRQPVKTVWVAPHERADAERFVREQVAQGRQAFVICPLVEESEALDVKAATAEYERLRRQVFPDLRLELLHGRMASKAKDEVMRRFRNGEADILVSTAVIEVGIDVPNASVMLIEGAERFGLAQLHQFRGRVGRGAEQSYCLLLSEEPTEEARKRLELMEETTDGFRLAEADMELRGPGQFFGTKQSGLPGLRVARLTDVKLIELTRNEAARMLDEDPGLTQPEHTALNQRVRRLIGDVVDEEH
ncbi:MAG: ATP-dependent DNA helicase RecG [Dehalococcoidia bacterium]